MTEKTKVGLIGAGKNSRFYAEKITFCIPLVELAAVPDVFMKAAANRAADYQITTVYQRHRPIVANNLIEAVLICSNTAAHPQFTKEPPNLFPPFNVGSRSGLLLPATLNENLPGLNSVV